MANKLRLDLKDAAELQKEMCMSSLKRALDDVEYNGCGAEPLMKKTCLPVSKRHIRGSTSGKKAKVGARTHCRLQSNKKHFQKAPPKHSLKVLSRTAASQSSDFEHKIDKSADIALKKKRPKRSADSLPNHTTEESDIKKRKVEQTITETEAGTENCQDSTKPANELNTTDAACDTSQRTESPKLVARLCGIPEYMREGNKEWHVQQNYNFRKNVAFARKVVVYSSDGSEYDYDYSEVDNGIGDNDDLYDDDLYDDDDLDDDDDDYEDVDPDAEVVSERLNLQIADFFKLHRNREPSVVKNVTKPQSGEVRPTELHETSSFDIGLFCKQPINNTYHELTSAGGSGVAAAAVAAGGFEHDENGNDAEEFDRASAVSNNLKHGVPW